MSRVILEPNSNSDNSDITEVVVGLDRVFGYFVQVWGVDPDEPTVDRDFLSQGDTLKLLEQFADLETLHGKYAYQRVSLDLDPGTTDMAPEYAGGNPLVGFTGTGRAVGARD